MPLMYRRRNPQSTPINPNQPSQKRKRSEYENMSDSGGRGMGQQPPPSTFPGFSQGVAIQNQPPETQDHNQQRLFTSAAFGSRDETATTTMGSGVAQDSNPSSSTTIDMCQGPQQDYLAASSSSQILSLDPGAIPLLESSSTHLYSPFPGVTPSFNSFSLIRMNDSAPSSTYDMRLPYQTPYDITMIGPNQVPLPLLPMTPNDNFTSVHSFLLKSCARNMGCELQPIPDGLEPIYTSLGVVAPEHYVTDVRFEYSGGRILQTAGRGLYIWPDDSVSHFGFLLGAQLLKLLEKQQRQQATLPAMM